MEKYSKVKINCNTTIGQLGLILGSAQIIVCLLPVCGLTMEILIPHAVK